MRSRYTVEINTLNGVRAVDAAVGGKMKTMRAEGKEKGMGKKSNERKGKGKGKKPNEGDGKRTEKKPNKEGNRWGRRSPTRWGRCRGGR